MSAICARQLPNLLDDWVDLSLHLLLPDELLAAPNLLKRSKEAYKRNAIKPVPCKFIIATENSFPCELKLCLQLENSLFLHTRFAGELQTFPGFFALKVEGRRYKVPIWGPVIKGPLRSKNTRHPTDSGENIPRPPSVEVLHDRLQALTFCYVFITKLRSKLAS